MSYKELMKHLNEVMIILHEEVLASHTYDTHQAIPFVWSLYGCKLIRDGKGGNYDVLHAMYMSEVAQTYGKGVLA